jgi:hypothetical protein
MPLRASVGRRLSEHVACRVSLASPETGPNRLSWWLAVGEAEPRAVALAACPSFRPLPCVASSSLYEPCEGARHKEPT